MTAARFKIRHSDFIRHSDLDIRHSPLPLVFARRRFDAQLSVHFRDYVGIPNEFLHELRKGKCAEGDRSLDDVRDRAVRFHALERGGGVVELLIKVVAGDRARSLANHHGLPAA